MPSVLNGTLVVSMLLSGIWWIIMVVHEERVYRTLLFIKNVAVISNILCGT